MIAHVLQQRRSALVIGLGLFTLLAVVAFSPRPEIAVGAPANGPGEAELTAKWWRWVYSLPVSTNPQFDETGANAANGQPFEGSKVFFLAGVLNVSGTAERSITVPAGTAIFSPILNIEWDNVGIPHTDPNYLSVDDLYAFAAFVMADADNVFATLNGVPLDYHHVVSPPFAYQLPKTDSVVEYFFGLDVRQVAPAVSDGYWFYIPPLKKGTYTVHYGGEFPDFGFGLDITYHITVN